MTPACVLPVAQPLPPAEELPEAMLEHIITQRFAMRCTNSEGMIWSENRWALFDTMPETLERPDHVHHPLAAARLVRSAIRHRPPGQRPAAISPPPQAGTARAPAGPCRAARSCRCRTG